MKILMLSSEVSPYAKTGGMADAVADLSQVLQNQGHDVRLILPFYSCVEELVDHEEISLEKCVSELSVPMRVSENHGDCYVCHDGTASFTYFVDHPIYFKRSYLYGPPEGAYEDSSLRFGFFAQSIFPILKELDWCPDIIHCHDWQSALVPLLLKKSFSEDPFFSSVKTLFTIHNLAYQGIAPKQYFDPLGLPEECWDSKVIEHFGQMNFLKAGLHFADALTTVSSRYSLEVQTPMFGHGLEGVLKARSKDLWGIVNGINTDIWSPSKDPLIAERFSTNNLVDKRGNKKELEDLCNFSEQGKMLVGMVSRLVTHKGFDVLTEAMSGLMKMDINIVIVGQGEKKWQHALSLMAQRYPNLTVILEYTELWAHQVYAGADLFLMPSSFEPCGLSQMKAMRYGTVPLVHETGGLADTVMPWSREDFSGCGFVMENYCAEDLLSQMTLALSLYQDKDSWVTLMKNGMTKDFSWKSSSQKYLSLYAHLLKKSVA